MTQVPSLALDLLVLSPRQIAGLTKNILKDPRTLPVVLGHASKNHEVQHDLDPFLGDAIFWPKISDVQDVFHISDLELDFLFPCVSAPACILRAYV